MHNIILKLKIDKDGNLIPANEVEKSKFKAFAAAAKSDDTLEAFITIVDGNAKTLGQLAKVHVLMRELANETGHSLQEMKSFVKERAGLVEIDEDGDKRLKSFTECTKSELSKAIQECIVIGDEIGCYLY